MQLKYYIDQPFGIGDILFLSPIVIELQKDNEVIWPINDNFIWIQDYFDINFIAKSKFTGNISDYYVIPFINAHQIVGCKYTMQAKYNLVNLDHENWKQLKWKRNISKENDLYYNALQLSNSEPYILVNINYADPLLKYKSNININTNLKIVNLDYIDGYTLLDWAKVIENAAEIHTVSTSLIYMIEVLYYCDMKNIHIYQRPIDTLSTAEVVGDIINPKWQIH